MTNGHNIPSSEPVIKTAAKPKTTAKPKPESFAARAPRLAAMSPSGWQIVCKVPVYGPTDANPARPGKFQCLPCGGWGRKGYIIEPKDVAARNGKGGDEATYTGADWADIESGKPGILKVGASCLWRFGLAL
jgi:hypothetical protein